MLTLSLATLLVPAFGWVLVQELEEFLRAGQEAALQGTARTMAQALPASHRARLYGREAVLPLRSFDTRPILDGYASEWPEPASALAFESADGTAGLQVLGGRWRGQDFLFLRVADESPLRERGPVGDPAGAPVDAVLLALRSGRGLVLYRMTTAAPGPLLITSQSPGGGQIEGYWLDTEGGYQLELALPATGRAVDLSLGVEDAHPGPAGVVRVREAGTFRAGRPRGWLSPVPQDVDLRAWLTEIAPADARAWVVDRRGWVVADTGPRGSAANRDPSWVERFIYRLVAGTDMTVLELRPPRLERFEAPLVTAAIDGAAGSAWGGDPETAEIRNTVAEPVRAGEAILGAVVLEAGTDGALLFTNRTLARLLLTSLALTLVLVAGLWFLATRLSRRVQTLSGAVSEAMADGHAPGALPMTDDRDELGELARNNARLLRAVAEYTRYLRTLAGRLSHELKTPLAITRTSLDNLAGGELDEDTRRYLERAREGLDRQTAIVRAMSEASRLEEAVAAADWETVDLGEVVRHCVDAYRGVHPDRPIDLEAPSEPVRTRCAPDLLAQALDKLVDNAVGLTAPDERITVRLAPRGNWRHLAVCNTGTRLPDTLRDQLFDSLVSVREPGSAGLHLGLGLHIVRLVAEAHGGSVEARDLPDERGVVFTLHLPADPDHAS